MDLKRTLFSFKLYIPGNSAISKTQNIAGPHHAEFVGPYEPSNWFSFCSFQILTCEFIFDWYLLLLKDLIHHYYLYFQLLNDGDLILDSGGSIQRISSEQIFIIEDLPEHLRALQVNIN